MTALDLEAKSPESPKARLLTTTHHNMAPWVGRASLDTIHKQVETESPVGCC